MEKLTHPFGPEARNYRHGHKPAGGISPEYLSWRGMRARCNNSQHPDFSKYGGRGITVCDRWRHFKPFLEDMGLKPTPSHSIDRIDNNGSYEPGNCRWATDEQQANNRRSNRFLECDGERKTLAEWAYFRGLRISTLHARLKAGWSVKDAITKPLRKAA